MCIYIYIHIQRERKKERVRERQREGERGRERERERERDRELHKRTLSLLPQLLLSLSPPGRTAAAHARRAAEPVAAQIPAAVAAEALAFEAGLRRNVICIRT